MPLSDAFVFDRVAVSQISSETLPTRDLGAVDMKGIDIVKLGQLRCLIAGLPFRSVLAEFPEVHAVSDDGPWVFEVSPHLVSALAEMDEVAVARTAEQWSKNQEFKLDGFDLSAVSSALHDLVKLSQLAQSRSQSVYLWTCL